ncbi:MAG TPA: hypothetical protein PLF13_09030 [candidate division Zixibacteria bacterium]|nr:hypothetical protein [candidate division Zixibacteria bacterium]
MKSIFIGVLIACLTLTPAGRALAQDLSDLVLPSREELDEALISGEIDPEQYRTLLDLIEQPVDSLRLHLLDNIPNLSFFAAANDSSVSILEKEQSRAFTATGMSSSRLVWRHRIAREMADDAASEYESGLILRPDNNWRVDLNVRRSQSGKERFTHRAVSYYDDNRIVREITAGDFSRRFGLGAAVGYRGRLIDAPSGYDVESFISPDNGSANGFYCRLAPGTWTTELLLSDHRNADYRLSSAAGSGGRDLRGRKIHLRLSFVASELCRRSGETFLHDVKLAFNAAYHYRGGRLEVESVVQAADSSGPAAVVLEASHKHKTASIRYAAWWYADRYLDLTGGSKAISLNRTFRFDDDTLTFSSRRSGQSGGLVRTILPLQRKLRLVSSLLTGWVNRDTTALQAMTALEYDIPGAWSLRVDLLERRTHRVTVNTTENYSYRKARLELRRSGDIVSFRGYLGHIVQEDEPDLTELFVTGTYCPKSRGEWQVWSDWRCRRFLEGTCRWYGFLLHRRSLSANLELLVKISHRYYSGEVSTHETTASAEIRLTL